MKNKIFATVALSAFFAFLPPLSAEPAPAENCVPAVPAEEKSTPAQLARVIVFPSGARITRGAKISLRAGEQEILLSGLPLAINETSLVAETFAPGARIASVSTEVRAAPPAASPDQAAVQAALENLRAKELALKLLREQISTHENFLKKLETLTPTVPAGTAPYIFDAESALRGINFSAGKQEETLAKKRALEAQEEEAALELEIARSEFAKLSSRRATETRLVRVKIFAPAPAEGEIFVHYIVGGASWRPCYDVRVDPATKTVALVSYGIVSQRTGEDWAGVPVSLSTARPTSSASLPEFKKNVITQRVAPAPSALGGARLATPVPADAGSSSLAGTRSVAAAGLKSKRATVADSATSPFAEPALEEASADFASATDFPQFLIDNAAGNAIVFSDGRTAKNVRDVRFQAGSYVFLNEAGVLEKAGAEDVAQIAQNFVEGGTGSGGGVPVAALRDPSRDLRGLDFRYELARPETIKSTGERHRYLLASENFSGDFYYRLEPAITDEAYQMAEVKNPNFRPILAGPANIFYGADFIGEMHVPYTVREGRVSIPLGVDRRVSVERKKINDIETVGAFSSARRNSVGVSVKVRNRTPEEIRIVSTEAVPVSKQKEIEISRVQFSPEIFEYSKETGIARWNEKIAPEAELEMRAGYRIDFPMNFELQTTERATPRPLRR